MRAVSPVLPGSADIEVTLGKDQPEYIPLPAVYLDNEWRPMITRWRFSEEERQAIAEGADLVMTQMTFTKPFQPVHLQIVGQNDMPELVGE